MPIFRNRLLVLMILAIVGIGVWFKLTYPVYEFVKIPVTIDKAKEIAKEFLKQKGIEPKDYLIATSFISDRDMDTFLQSAMNVEVEKKFIENNKLTMFSWALRFFQNNKKEEYNIQIDTKNGKVIYFNHTMEETKKEELISRDESYTVAKDFLMANKDIDFSQFIFHAEQTNKLDNRTDYYFSWEKKDVYIPWKEKDGGLAKVLISTTVTGKKIKGFSLNYLNIPEKFHIYINRQNVRANFLASFESTIELIWLFFATMLFMRQRNNIILSQIWKPFLFISLFLGILQIIYNINNYNPILMSYFTDTTLTTYLSYGLLNLLIQSMFITLPLVFIGPIGEFLFQNQYPNKIKLSLYYPIVNSFVTKNIAKSIIFGYLLAAIILGVQSLTLYLFRENFTVLIERFKFAESFIAVFPFLGAFIVGISAALFEEITFRLFAISLFKRYLKKTVYAVILSAFLWCLGHTPYAIYPIWIRGFETFIIGVLFAIFFLKFGLISTIICHYVFNVFISISAYIFGQSTPFLLFSSLAILILPLILALICQLINKPEKSLSKVIKLNKIQEYNLNILCCYIEERKRQGLSKEEITNQLLAHDWDSYLINQAIEKIFPS